MDAKKASAGADEADGRYSDAEKKRLEQEIAELRMQLEEVKTMVAELSKLLKGNNDADIRELIDHLVAVVEGLGRTIETLHRQCQLQADMIECLVQKSQLEKILLDVSQAWQSINVHRLVTAE
jgi:hypothetical protein